MIGQTTVLVLGGCLLGAIQLIAGIAIGLWIRRGGNTDRGQHDLHRASVIAQRLKSLMAEISSSAHAHRSELDIASQQLESDDSRTDGALAELVVNVIGDIVQANQKLQSQLETAESRLEEQALEIEGHISRSLTDPLTGLPNRREFNDRLEERMSAWTRRKEEFSLLMLDVDHFKKLNDEHGHLAGDQVLAAIARALRSAVRREDTVTRYGGEEFAILLPNTSLEQAQLSVEKIHQAVARVVVEHNGQTIAVTISGGLAAIEPGDTAESLIQKADTALYAAKASGRNRTCIHDGGIAGAHTAQTARLVELIQSADREKHATGAAAEPIDVGSFLPRDAISNELAQTCDELRRLLEERQQTRSDATPVAKS